MLHNPRLCGVNNFAQVMGRIIWQKRDNPVAFVQSLAIFSYAISNSAYFVGSSSLRSWEMKLTGLLMTQRYY